MLHGGLCGAEGSAGAASVTVELPDLSTRHVRSFLLSPFLSFLLSELLGELQGVWAEVVTSKVSRCVLNPPVQTAACWMGEVMQAGLGAELGTGRQRSYLAGLAEKQQLR